MKKKILEKEYRTGLEKTCIFYQRGELWNPRGGKNTQLMVAADSQDARRVTPTTTAHSSISRQRGRAIVELACVFF